MQEVDEAARAPRILIGIPTGDMIYSLTALHFAGLLAMSRENGIEAVPSLACGSMATNNMSNLAHQSVGATGDALLMIEWDMVFPPRSLMGLLASGEDKDIIGATYMQRRDGGETHGFELDGARIDVSRGGPVREVASLPFGFLLIRRRVFEALEAAGDLPFFRLTFERGNPNSASQDYDFCKRVRALGFKVWLDPELSLAIGHIGVKTHQIERVAT